MIALPNFENGALPGLGDRKNIIRSFFTQSYSMSPRLLFCYTHWVITGEFTSNPNAAVPWGNLASDPHSWIEGLDAGLVVKEPSKMTTGQINAVFQYLLQRQSVAADSPRLQWIKALERDDRTMILGGGGKEAGAANSGSKNNAEEGKDGMEDSDAMEEKRGTKEKNGKETNGKRARKGNEEAGSPPKKRLKGETGLKTSQEARKTR